ncbi:MAG: hypothetical protein NVS2B7_02620 [Herpetosiphon sp.]
MANRRPTLIVALLLLVACSPAAPATTALTASEIPVAPTVGLSTTIPSSTVATATEAPVQTQAGASPTAQQPAATEPPTGATTVELPTLPPPLTALPALPTARSTVAATTPFIVPARKQSAGPEPLPAGSYAHPDVPREVQAVFARFYAARSIERGHSLDIDHSARLVGGAFADYTLPLLRRETQLAVTGKLLETHYSAIKATLQEWLPAEQNALVEVTRTRTDTTPAGVQKPLSATLRFRVHRQRVGTDQAAWVITDFFNPSTKEWVSSPPAGHSDQVTGDVFNFFEEFYAARSFERGKHLDLTRASMLVALAYAMYTMPLLEQQQAEADQGKLLAIAYRDINIHLLNYDPRATDHGGLATVDVTRTAVVTRSAGAEAPQTATYRFRVHRHTDELGHAYWVAVDFFQPSAQKWVSEIQGFSVSVPGAGHG